MIDDKEKILNRIEHLTMKMKNTESTFFKHLYFVEIKNLEKILIDGKVVNNYD